MLPSILLLCEEEGGGGVGMSSCLLSTFLLLSTRYIRYLIAIWRTFFMVLFISAIGNCSIFRSSILLMCIAPLTLPVIVIRGLVFKPCAVLAYISGLCLLSFVCMAGSINLSLVIRIVRSGVGIKGSFCLYATPCMYTMSGRSFARHSHHVLLHVHHSIHGGMVLSC